MKLQCPCGAKYAFDLSPEMVQNPVTFVCPTCGLDSSEFVNEMVRREFGAPAPEYTPPVSAPPPDAPAPAPRLKISHSEKPAEPPPETAPVSKYCQKHRGVLTTEQCTVCHKPICPQCLELFGFFCSPFCQNKADMQGITAPVYAGQKHQVERRFWRHAGLGFGALGLLLAAGLAAWTWYAWFGSVPHNYFAVRFGDDDRAYVGKSVLVGKDQMIFLHGGTLARCDLKNKKTVWRQELISKDDIAAVVKAENDADARASADGGFAHHVSQEVIEREAKIGLQEELNLRVSGQNVWVGKGDKLTRYDWDTGKVAREITLPESGGELVETGGELQMLGAESVTHISLATGEARTEQFRDPNALALAATSGAGNPAPGGGLFSTDGKPLDPNRVAAEAQNLKLPARIALPALVANAQHEQQLEAALRDDPPRPRVKNSPANVIGRAAFELVSGPDGFVQFSRTLLEEKFVERSAMKAAPAKPALDGNVNGLQAGAVANELLNEMQRNNGGDKVTEDESRYQVTVHLPNAAGTPDWTGEVTGPPQLFVLKTVNVIAAGKNIVVLDKANKKIWQTALTYAVSGGRSLFNREPQFGAGPCVEHGDTLYVFDQAVLSALELSTGNARWRIPSVGVVGLFFDENNFIYVNTTSGNPDDIKYSRQIDITKSTDDILLKLDPQNGKTLWSVKPGGFISYLSGKFIYTVQSYDPNPNDTEQMSDMALQKPAYLRIARVSPKNGRILWEHQEDSCPIDVRFNDNSIELIFKREVQVLKYLTF